MLNLQRIVIFSWLLGPQFLFVLEMHHFINSTAVVKIHTACESALGERKEIILYNAFPIFFPLPFPICNFLYMHSKI